MLIIKKISVTHGNVFALEYGCVKQVHPQTKHNQDKSKSTCYTIRFSLCKELDGERWIPSFHFLHFLVTWQINIHYSENPEHLQEKYSGKYFF